MSPRTIRLKQRPGFVLLVVLSVLVSAAALEVMLSTTSAEALDSIRNRVELTRAGWLAEGCLEGARASIAEALSDQRQSDKAWNDLDSVVLTSSMASDCDLRAEPAGLRVDVNVASEAELHTLFQSLPIRREEVDSIVDAILDWRDPDDEPRPLGAERDWYEQEGRLVPRNDSFASVEELRLVRGLEHIAGLDSLLGVDPDRIWLERAPLPVIATLPGMSSEAVARIAERREERAPIGDLLGLAGALTKAARDSLLAHYTELLASTTSVPDAWTLIARSKLAPRAPTVVIELRLKRAGARAAIVRRLSEP